MTTKPGLYIFEETDEAFGVTTHSPVGVKLIGDPHLGREFVNGVPMERRGERENSQYKQLEEELSDPDAQIYIVVGDLFDKFQVKNDVLMRTFLLINNVANRYPSKTYHIMMGNHDVSRDVDRVSSYQVLKSMCSHLNNVYFNDKPTYLPRINVMLFPYDAFTSASDVVVEQTAWLEMHKPIAVVGHWDVDSFGDGKDFNLVPLEQLKEHTTQIFTGHIHRPEVRELGDVTLTITGSMQPYSHAEDPEGKIYVTVTLEEFEKDPTIYVDKAVRFKLKPGEEIPAEVNARQIAMIRVTDTSQEELEVKMEVFSFETVFNECLEAAGVPADRITTVWNDYKELTNAETA